MSSEKRDLVPYYEVLPPAQQTSAYAVPQMPTLPSAGGYFDRRALEKRTRFVSADTALLNARAAQTNAFASVISATAAAERALYALDRLPELLQEEWDDGRARRQYDRELLRHDHDVACEQRAYSLAQVRVTRDALERAHDRDMQIRDAQHCVMLADAEHVLARTRADIEQFTKSASTAAVPQQSTDTDPVVALRTAINVARARGDSESARRFEAALAALSPRLANTGS